MKQSLIFSICLMAMASCTQFPNLDNTVTAEEEAADFPTLLPLSQIANAANAITISEDTTSQVQTKLDALKAKANILRNPVLTRAERRKLLEAIDAGPERIEALFPVEPDAQ